MSDSGIEHKKKKKHPLNDKRINLPLAGLGGLILGIVIGGFIMSIRNKREKAREIRDGECDDDTNTSILSNSKFTNDSSNQAELL